MSSALVSLVRAIRPAPLGAAVAQLLGVNRRRKLNTSEGIFFIDPCSNLGASLTAGGYEPQMANVLRKYLGAGSTFIDMGANEGYFSVIASRIVGEMGTVVAIEPQTRLQPVILKNLELNGCTNVRIAKTAVCAQTAQVAFHLASSLNTGSSSLAERGERNTEMVSGLSLKDFVATERILNCDLMKVDIEGAEYEVFLAAGDVLRSGTVRNIVLEIHNSVLQKRGLKGIDLHNHILDCGYKLDNSLGHWVYTFGG